MLQQYIINEHRKYPVPRERAKLSDKQERILVQAQLMGLTAHDMQQIGNRLVALKKEAEIKQEVIGKIEGFSWTKDAKGLWTITSPDGYVCKFTKTKTGRHSYWDSSWDYTVSIAKPGTAFKTRVHQKKSVHFKQYPAKLCPENSKELYSIICFLNNHLQYLITHK